MKKKQTDDVADFAGAPAPKALGPADVQQKEFRVSRFGGYRMRDVDEFLDQITESMNAMVEENRRLRSRGGGSRQSDEIIQRARVEAAQIIEEARAGAAGSSGVATPAPGPAVNRAPVSAFLAQERSFLQGLAGLVQEHAETVKGLARADRAAMTGARGPAATMSAPPSGSPTAAPSGAARSSRSSGSKTAQTPSTGTEPGVSSSDPRPTVPIANVEEPIRVDEPASTSAGARRDDDRPGDAPDRSLRELFWGED
jgi:DivIVA domain-containing protein